MQLEVVHVAADDATDALNAQGNTLEDRLKDISGAVVA
jgi:hypothetical protein